MDVTFAATVDVVPETFAAYIRLTGDVDLAAEGRLREILSVLSAVEARDIYIDLGGVGFAGTSLISFLVRAGASESLNGPLVLRRVPPNVVSLIELVGLQVTIVIRGPRPANRARAVPRPTRAPG